MRFENEIGPPGADLVLKVRSGGGGVAQGRDVGPGEAVGGPEALEGGVGGVAEAVPVAEVVQPALAVVVVLVAEPDEPADRVHVPRDGLRLRERGVGGSVTERGI